MVLEEFGGTCLLVRPCYLVGLFCFMGFRGVCDIISWSNLVSWSGWYGLPVLDGFGALVSWSDLVTRFVGFRGV